MPPTHAFANIAPAVHCLLACFVACVCQVAVATGQDPPSQEAPFLPSGPEVQVSWPTTQKNRLGYTMQVRIPDEAVASTMRVEIEFASTGGPTTADRAFALRFEPIEGNHSLPTSPLRGRAEFVIPQGTQRLRLARHLPKASFGNRYLVALLEDNRTVDGCVSQIGSPARASYSNADHVISMNARRRFLWIDSETDDETRAASLEQFMLSRNSGFLSEYPTEQMAKAVLATGEFTLNRDQFRCIANEQMPSDWRAYVNQSIVIVHQQSWDDWQQSSAPAAKALGQWVRAGGNVLVRNVSQARWNTLPPANPESAQRLRTSVSAVTAALNGWIKNLKGLDPVRYFQSNQPSSRIQSSKKWLTDMATRLQTSIDEVSPRLVADDELIRITDLGAGQVIYARAPEPSPDESEAVEMVHASQWSLLEITLGWRLDPSLRRGVDPILGSSRFYQWVIPGVAQPPVYTFMGLLGLFAVLVGPVAYRKSAKTGRSYLMFLIAPGLAVATTVLMLTYSVVSDGFGTKTRIRQITWLDGNTGQATTRTRCTYFAGISPSRGMRFDGDAMLELYPDNQQRPWEIRSRDRFQPRGQVTVDGESLRLSRELIPSRQQCQFVFKQPRPDWGQLKLLKSTGGAQWQLENDTETDLADIVFTDDQGEYYGIESLTRGQTMPASPLTTKEASELLGDLYKRQWLVSTLVNRGASRNRNQYRGMTTDLITEQVGMLDNAVRTVDGLFEYELQQRMQLGSKLPPRSFVATANIEPAAIAVEGAQVIESIHYVIGTMP